MELAKVLINLGTTHVEKVNVTPAELLFYMIEHRKAAKGKVVVEMQVTGNVQRSSIAEFRRISNLFGRKKAAMMFTGVTPQLPQTFKEIEETTESGTELPPTEELLDGAQLQETDTVEKAREVMARIPEVKDGED